MQVSTSKKETLKTKETLNYEHLILSCLKLAILTVAGSSFTINPFLIGMYTYKADKKNISTFLCIPFIILGILITKQDLLKYFLIITFVTILTLMLQRHNNLTEKAFISFNGVILSCFMYMIITGFSTHKLIGASVEGLLTVLFLSIVSYSETTFKQYEKKKMFTPYNLLGISIYMSSYLLAFKKIDVFGINISIVLGLYLCIYLAYNFNTLNSLLVGVGTGVIIGFTNPNILIYIASFVFVNLTVILTARLGKKVTIPAILLCMNILKLLLGTYLVFNYFELFIAVVLFAVTPNLFTEKREFAMATKSNLIGVKNQSTKVYDEKLLNIVSSKVTDYARSFEKLEKVYDKIVELDEKFTELDYDELVNKVATKSCSMCNNIENCWERNSKKVYNDMLAYFRLCKEGVHINTDNFIINECIQRDNITHQLDKILQTEHLNNSWKKKLNESRSLSKSQFNCISNALYELNNEISNNVDFIPHLEKLVERKLRDKNIKIENITILKSRDDLYYIEVLRNRSIISMKDDDIILNIIESVLKKPLKRFNTSFSAKNNLSSYKTIYIEKSNIHIDSGVSRVVKDSNGVCGDCYIYGDINTQKYYSAISDGIGTGIEAYKESHATLEIIDNLLTSGFKNDISLDVINSMLLTKSLEELYATLDLIIYDLYNSTAEFTKLGAVPSYIIGYDKSIRVIKSNGSMPVGVFEKAKPNTQNVAINKGDVIISMSDGLLEHVNMLTDNIEDYMITLLNNLSFDTPKEMADEIIYKTINNDLALDDITVFVSKIS